VLRGALWLNCSTTFQMGFTSGCAAQRLQWVCLLAVQYLDPVEWEPKGKEQKLARNNSTLAAAQREEERKRAKQEGWRGAGPAKRQSKLHLQKTVKGTRRVSLVLALSTPCLTLCG
jgi:hypothetical protein